MSAYPLMLDGSKLTALIVGGGAVAARKARALLDSGATVRVVAPETHAELAALNDARVTVQRRTYESTDIDGVDLVIAATSVREVNARVAADARARGRLVNVVDAPAEGNCTTPAVHRAGDLVIAVTAGGVPAAAARVRDEIASRYSDQYADALANLASLRSELLGAGQRDRWAAAAADVIGPDFCRTVERGALTERLLTWR